MTEEIIKRSRYRLGQLDSLKEAWPARKVILNKSILHSKVGSFASP